MMNNFLDKKHGFCIGRVWMLIALFIFNAFMPIGAAMKFLYDMTGILLYVGIVGTVICIGILSTPTKVEEDKE